MKNNTFSLERHKKEKQFVFQSSGFIPWLKIKALQNEGVNVKMIQRMESRDHRVGVFNFGTDRVRVLEKTSGSGSGTDRVRVLALHFYHSGIIGYRKS